jgi:hypothetical protein
MVQLKHIGNNYYKQSNTPCHQKNKAMKMKPQKKDNMFYLEGISDSSFGEDKDTRISVFGYVVYFCGALVATKSKLGRSVTLSSKEAEDYAISKVAKEVFFIKQLLETIGIEVKLPIIVRVDNVGAIFLGNNFFSWSKYKTY